MENKSVIEKKKSLLLLIGILGLVYASLGLGLMVLIKSSMILFMIITAGFGIAVLLAILQLFSINQQNRLLLLSTSIMQLLGFGGFSAAVMFMIRMRPPSTGEFAMALLIGGGAGFVAFLNLLVLIILFSAGEDITRPKYAGEPVDFPTSDQTSIPEPHPPTEARSVSSSSSNSSLKKVLLLIIWIVLNSSFLLTSFFLSMQGFATLIVLGGAGVLLVALVCLNIYDTCISGFVSANKDNMTKSIAAMLVAPIGLAIPFAIMGLGSPVEGAEVILGSFISAIFVISIGAAVMSIIYLLLALSEIGSSDSECVEYCMCIAIILVVIVVASPLLPIILDFIDVIFQ